ncbi:MAG: DUF6174 domain-containing protein [Acidimicrobiia bacterium]
MSTRRHTPMRTTTITALLLLTVLAACGPASVDGSTTLPPVSVTTRSTQPPTETTGPEPTGPEAALADAKARWAAAGLDTYQFVYENDCGECDPGWAAPRSVVVWDSASFDGDRTDVDITDLFERIAGALTEGSDVEVAYDPELGFPVEIWIDREARAYDGGTHLLVHQFTQGLPGNSVSLADLESARERWASARPAAYEFRTDIMCDCPWDTTMWALIDGERVVDWRVEWIRQDGALNPAPSTIEQLFEDLHDLISSGEVAEAGARITGTASYHPEMGYPTWIGLDIEILDPGSELAVLAPRVVVSIRDLQPQDVAASQHAGAVERWAQSGPGDYRYELTVHDIVEASFGPPHHVTVRDDEVISVTVDGAEVDADSVPAYAIDDLFAQIDIWRADGWNIDVLYDRRLGHPVLVTGRNGDGSIVFSIDRLTPG